MYYHIELQRNNVTVAEFFHYIRAQCAKKGIAFNLSRDDFEQPHREYSDSYRIKDGKKLGHSSEYRPSKQLRPKISSITTSEGKISYYDTGELEEYEGRELVSYDWTGEAEDCPFKAETFRQFPYDYQSYMLANDGACYNEICEFTFDTESRGHGYYYQVNKDPD